MKCPRCGWPTRVIETRKRQEGYALRRVRECRFHHKSVSWEMSESTHKPEKWMALRATSLALFKGQAATWKRDLGWYHQFKAGHKHAVIAHMAGKPVTTVQYGINRVRAFVEKR